MASTINGTSTGNGGLISTGDDSGILNIQTNETTAITVDASQNVGIGATTPADALNIGVGKKFRATHSASVYQQIFSSSSGNFINAYGDNFQLTADSGAMYLTTTAAQPMVFQTTNADRMRIDSSGRMIMASNANGLLGQIQAGITANSASTNSVITSTCNSSGPYPFGARGETSSQGLFGFFNESNSVIGSITRSGSNVAYNTSSDYRLKENIAPMIGALAKVAQLKPVTYTWKADGLDGEGFIAHELAEVKPHAVFGEKDAVETYLDDEGNEQTRIKPQGIDTSFLVATLTAAIQELKAINDTQAETINALTARIVAIESKA
jgi:hypothetical protein